MDGADAFITASKKARAACTNVNCVEGKNHANDVAKLREVIMAAQAVLFAATEASKRLQVKHLTISRSGYLRTLKECVGPSPPGKTWKDEWVAMKVEAFKLSQQAQFANEKYVMEKSSVPQMIERFQRSIGDMVNFGWPRDRAETVALITTDTAAIGRALREGDPCYAASTHALYDGLYIQRKNQKKAPNMMYSHLWGKHSLSENDPGWKGLEKADHTGFKGLLCTSITNCTRVKGNFTEQGYALYVNRDGKGTFDPVDSDVVGFESAPDDEHGAHMAILGAHENSSRFPPNTLFRLKEIKGPGEWEAPGGVYPKQRLMVVTATYKPPGDADGMGGGGGNKLCGNTVTLSYASREAFINGLDDILTKPVLTMQQEFSREMSWVDWEGEMYTLKTEWAYVMQGKVSTSGSRDAGNAGKSPQDFLRIANDFIRKRRSEGNDGSLPESAAFLALDEAMAIRLYSGPAYQPINSFLRQISNLKGEYRAGLADHVMLTFAATVGHVCRGIRKLAAISTPTEVKAKLYRGVRGELPRAFWLPDEQGMVCATDTAFMSTSRNRKTPVDFMQGAENVLWELEPSAQTDSGFHCGADIRLLSQYPAEEEVLFPPCTMLMVKKGCKGDKKVTDGSKSYCTVEVLPTFI